MSADGPDATVKKLPKFSEKKTTKSGFIFYLKAEDSSYK